MRIDSAGNIVVVDRVKVRDIFVCSPCRELMPRVLRSQEMIKARLCHMIHLRIVRSTTLKLRFGDSR